GASMEVIASIPQNTQLPPPLSNLDIVRAWRDPRYRRSLSAEQLQRLPGNPAGPSDLTADELKAAAGLALGGDFVITTAITCTECSFQHWKSCGCIPETTAINCTLTSPTCGCN
ncbi:MAG TPA: mersacidin/lichenicidin family type 2 lantibiotic, partial [Candidatus Angelobacter sp.]